MNTTDPIQSYDPKTGLFKDKKIPAREMTVHKDIEHLYSGMIFISLLAAFGGVLFILFTGNYFNYFKQTFVFSLGYMLLWGGYFLMRELVKTKKNSLTHNHFKALFNTLKFITISFIAINILTVSFIYLETHSFLYLTALDERIQSNDLMIFITLETFFRAIFILFILIPLMRMSADYVQQEQPDTIPEDGVIHTYLTLKGHKTRKLIVFYSLIVSVVICYFLPNHITITPIQSPDSVNDPTIEITQNIINNANNKFKVEYRTVYSNSNWACDTNMDQDLKYEPFSKNRIYFYSPFVSFDSRNGKTTNTMKDNYYEPGFCKLEFEGVEYRVIDTNTKTPFAQGSFRLDSEQICPLNMINIKANPSLMCKLESSSKYDKKGDGNFYLELQFNMNDPQRIL